MTEHAEVTTPRHPFAFAVYGGYLLLSLAYLTDYANAKAVSALTGGQEWVWQVPLTVAALVALVGVCMPRRRRLFGLLLEASGAGVLSLEVFIYVWSIAEDNKGGTLPAATMIIFGSIALGLFARFVQALMERGRVVQSWVSQAEQVTEALAESEGEGEH